MKKKKYISKKDRQSPAKEKNVSCKKSSMTQLEQLIFLHLYESYKKHRDIFRETPDHIADVAIVQTVSDDLETEFDEIWKIYTAFLEDLEEEYMSEK